MAEKLSGLTYHMTPREYYEVQLTDQDYQPEPMLKGEENFIHCTTGAQNVVDTAHRYYLNDPRPFCLLVIDLDKVRAPARYDAPNQIFPHIYGPLNRDAIVTILPFNRTPDGHFLKPE